MIGLAYRWASLKDPFKEIIGARLYTLLHIKIFKIPVHLLNYLELFVNIWSTITFFALFSQTLQGQYFFEVAIEFPRSILRNIFRLRSFISRRFKISSMKFQMRHQIYFELIVWIRLHVFYRERDGKKSEYCDNWI